MNSHLEGLAANKKIASDWDAGWNNSDVEALLTLYAENPILLPQGQPAIPGKDAIRLMYQSVFKDFIIKGLGEIVAVESSGNLGYFVKLQDDNSWKIALLMDNSDEEA